ncbi:MAG: PQQ-binding-like beta-propeller repeat protein [Planctomycetota bacterium]|nr:PQQ-binding-like beta-propeller repeat protein [Planctomycetota bacterium]
MPGAATFAGVLTVPGAGGWGGAIPDFQYDPAVILPALPAMQALAAVLPQLLAILGATLMAVLKPNTYKVLFRYLWTHKLFSAGLVAFIALGVWGIGRIGRGSYAAEKVGAAWWCYRGGAERTGAVEGAKGPLQGARVAWKKQENKLDRVDSSPCVVGNRVYVSIGTLSPFGDSGSVYCRDTQTGGEVWRWTGQGLPTKLLPIYSSPAVGGELLSLPRNPDGSPQQGKYLAVGEGYHLDFNSRIICLDLEPVRTGKARVPALKWAKQTTCHVESSPCIYGGRVYVGAADDGVWCVELETGRVVWHIEGTPVYHVKEGQKADELAKMAGRTVAATGTVERIGATAEEAGQVVIAIEEWKEGADASAVPVNIGDGFRRTVVGRVVVAGKQPTVKIENRERPIEGASRVGIAPDPVCVDVESSPVGVELKVGDAEAGKAGGAAGGGGAVRKLVYFGCGLGGPAVVCADAETGRIVWRKDMPYPVFSSPSVRDGRVIVGMGKGDIINRAADPKGEIRCFSAADGTEIWKVDVGDTVIGAVAIKDGTAYAACCDKRLYAVDIREGRIIGTYTADAPMVSSPAVTDDAVYLSTGSGKVFCVDRKTRGFRWSMVLSPGQGINSSPIVAEGRLYVGTVDSGLFCLEEDPAAAARRGPKPWEGAGGNAARRGAVDDMGLPTVQAGARGAPRKWRHYVLCDVDAEGKVSRPRAVEGPVAACGSWLYLPARGPASNPDAILLARIDARLGREAWAVDIGGAASAVAANGESIWVLAGPESGPHKAVRLNAADGSRILEVAGPFAPGTLAMHGDRLAAASPDGALVCFRASDGGKIWTASTGGNICGAPAAFSDMFFVAVAGAKPQLLCIHGSSGKVLWTSELPGVPAGPPSVDGDGVFVACAASGGSAGGLAGGGASGDGSAGAPGSGSAGIAGGKDGGGAGGTTGGAPDAGAPGGTDKGFVTRRSIRNGREVWTRGLPEEPAGYVAVSDDDDIAAVAGKGGKLFALRAGDGGMLREGGLFVGEGLRPPALAQGTLVFAATRRFGAWNPRAASWPWNLGEQGLIGRALSSPVVAAESVFVATERRGLVAVGAPVEEAAESKGGGK